MADLIFEIGLEEVPAAFMPQALEDLRKLAEKKLAEARLSYGQLETFGTPRRFVLSVKDLADAQDELLEKVRGPAVKIAYDNEGQATKALEGFCRGQGLSLEDVYIEELKGQDYVFVNKKSPGRKAEDILAELLPELISSMDFPKSMRWGSYDMRFVRPIHWMLALLDEQLISFEIEVARSGRHSYGHRTLSPDAIDFPSAAEYFAQMRTAWVIVNPDERRLRIIEELNEIEKREKFTVDKDEMLLEEIIHLVEYPTCFIGHFNKNYLELPKELVTTPMKDHQRYFPVFNQEGGLAPFFIGVRNGNSEYLNEVKKGNENVLEARLQDALFFYNEDLKQDLDQWKERLKDIIFQEKLGSMLDKSKRNRALVESYSKRFSFDDETSERAQRAAEYAKVDLVSLVVGEFPELQGLMGENYLNACGEESLLVGQAVREHYLPRFNGDILPESKEGLLLSVADKMDTIVACFAAGIEPTGSQDPYALRRQATGIVTMLVENELDVSLKGLIADAVSGLPKDSQLNKVNLDEKVYDFFAQRLKSHLEEKGYKNTFVRALLKAGYDRILERVTLAEEAETWIRNSPDAFEQMKTLYKRVYNILEPEKNPRIEVAVDPDVLQEHAEKELYDAVVQAYRQIDHMSHRARLNSFLALTPMIERFFEDVMVMVQDEELKENRLNLLYLYMKLVSDLIRIEAL